MAARTSTSRRTAGSAAAAARRGGTKAPAAVATAGKAGKRGGARTAAGKGRGAGARADAETAAAAGSINAVHLRGRLSGEPEARTLPSGDEVVSFRVVVPRVPVRSGAGGRAGVDTIDCAAFAAPVRRAVLRWTSGDAVEVQGALHRRFYAGPAGRASRYEVEVRTAARATAAAAQERGTMTG